MRYAVEVASVVKRVIMVNAANEELAAKQAEAIVKGFKDVTAVKAVSVCEATINGVKVT